MDTKISKPERRRLKIRSQARIIQATDLGRELINILDSLDQYKNTYYELKKPVDEFFTKWIEKKLSQLGEISPNQLGTSRNKIDTVRNSILKERGFTHKDLEFYDDFAVGTAIVLRALEGKLLEIITVRAALMLYKFGITDQNAKGILNKILVDAVKFRVKYLTENIRVFGSEIDLYRAQIAEELMYEIKGGYYFPAIIQQRVKNAILSYLSLLKPPKRDVEIGYKEIKANLKLLSSEELKKEEQRLVCLLDAYEVFMNKTC